VAINTKLTQPLLDSLNVEQARGENRKALETMGGVDALARLMGVNLHTGLTHSQVEAMRANFGDNAFPEAPLDSYLSLLFEALTDGTLLILIAAASVSLVIGIITEPDHGWIEGGAIFIAVFLVSNIAAGNDYTKQLQFRALEHSSAEDERCSVLRAGNIERINPKEIVVGDLLILQVSFLFSSRSSFKFNFFSILLRLEI
jgi:magnesium-transporting ATPase (P-type)